MADRSKRIVFNIPDEKLNKENIKLWKKYEMNMDLRELSKKTIYGYKTDLYSWFRYIYLYKFQKENR